MCDLRQYQGDGRLAELEVGGGVFSGGRGGDTVNE
jgi:hypothetical protein